MKSKAVKKKVQTPEIKKEIIAKEEDIMEQAQEVQTVKKVQQIDKVQKVQPVVSNALKAKIADQKQTTVIKKVQKIVQKPKPPPPPVKPQVFKPQPIGTVIQQPIQQQRLAHNQIMGGFYGGKVQTNINEENAIYNDDEPILEKVKQNVKFEQPRIDIQIKAQRTMVKLKEETNLPAMCSIKTSGGERSNVDLICVIDVSGSMNGQKIQLVKDTMKFLIETLTPSDRLSIITFNDFGSRLCGLKCCTPENMAMFNGTILGLQAGGGTTINSGLNLALKVMRDRKHQNTVTSIFLLSDGQDKGAELQFQKSLVDPQNKEVGVFTIHSFGFGNDHDQDLMTKICQLKDGSFYFIKELATLDEAFCNALGGIISVVASQMVIKLNNVSKNIVQGIKITKTYGTMWNKINQREYNIKLLQLMSGISKDFVFEIHIPAINTQVGDLDRNHDAIEGIFTAKGVKGQNINGHCCLKLTLLNHNQDIPQVNQNVDVIENYLRMKATQAIEQNMKKAENNQFEDAQHGIDQMINAIQTNKKVRKEKMDSIVTDLQLIKQKCSKQDYQGEGKKWMKNAQMAHGKQANYAYSNQLQQEMVSKVKSKKMG